MANRHSILYTPLNVSSFDTFFDLSVAFINIDILFRPLTEIDSENDYNYQINVLQKIEQKKQETK